MDPRRERQKGIGDAIQDESSTHHNEAVLGRREPYGASGFRGLFSNSYVVACAAFSTFGSLLFRFTRVSKSASGAGFWKGLLTATIELGALIGVLNQGWIADRISRKYSIVVAVGFFIVGSALPTGAVDYALLTTARLIGGIGIGMLSMVVPLYISEIVPPEIRGSLLVLEEFAIVAGIAVAFWISYGTRFMDGEWAWRLPFLLQIVLGLVLGAGILLLPFSLRWLVSKGRHEEPKRNLVKLRSAPENNERLKLELLDIQAEVAFHQEVSRERHPNLQDESKSSSFKVEIVAWKDCFKRGCWRRMHVRMGLMFFQQLVGVSTSVWAMGRFGRRRLLLWGMFMSHLIIAVLVGKFGGNWQGHHVEGWVSVSRSFISTLVSFGASWGPVPWAMPSEIFPSSLRAKGVALSTCSNWFNNFIIGLITPVFSAKHGTYLFVPETAHKTLEQMDLMFKDSTGEREEDRGKEIESEIIVRRASSTEGTPLV